jgi:hypothetical protein
MKRVLLCGLAALLLHGFAPSLQGGIHAQMSVTLREGEKIRIGLVDERDRRSGVAGLPDANIKLRRVSGTLMRIESDTIFVRLNAAASVRYSLSEVVELERWSGSTAPAVTAVIGGLVGGVIGGLIMKSATDQELGFWLGAAPGAPAGALAGWHFMGLRSWSSVPVDRVRFGGPPQASGTPGPVVQPQAELRFTIPLRRPR